MQKKILVVDDEPDAVEVLALRLANRGYEVSKAYSGAEALKVAARERPDLILMDILMPGIDGARTAEMLRDNPGTKHIPVIFITCMFTKEDEKKGSVIGDTYFIAKPYDAEELLKVVEEYVE